ncbi:MAG TPA: sugar phosphate isomerase/epimerase family protein [Vicinamibacteria bacterium]|jgi:sugar phosphate isomerase/epimerase
MSCSRRAFLGTLASTALARAAAAPAAEPPAFKGTVCLFSKHLPLLEARALGRAVKPLGFGGVDLTVRPGGHVPPERAGTDLAPFVRALRAEGLDVPMISTALVSASDPAAAAILETAGREQVRYFKAGYFRYRFADVRREIEEAGQALRGLAELGARHGVQLGYHNHAGYVGGPVWDIARVMDTLDPRAAGYYFDVRHAVVEGGDAGWRTALLYAAPRLKMVAVKDFFWEKTDAGWKQRNCPLGQGMVDWKAFFAILAGASFHGPVSLHLEYDIPGATPAAQQEHTLAAAARDLGFLTAHLGAAYRGAGS